MNAAHNPHARADEVFASDLPPLQRLALLAIDRVMQGGDGVSCTPSSAELARMTGMSWRAAQYAIARLSAAGAIQLEHRPGRRTIIRFGASHAVRGSIGSTSAGGLS